MHVVAQVWEGVGPALNMGAPSMGRGRGNSTSSGSDSVSTGINSYSMCSNSYMLGSAECQQDWMSVHRQALGWGKEEEGLE